MRMPIADIQRAVRRCVHWSRASPMSAATAVRQLAVGIPSEVPAFLPAFISVAHAGAPKVALTPEYCPTIAGTSAARQT